MQSTGAEPGPVQQELEVLFFASRYVRYDGFGEASLIFKLLIFALLFFEEATSVFFFFFFLYGFSEREQQEPGRIFYRQ